MTSKIILIFGFILLGFIILKRLRGFSNVVVFNVYPKSDYFDLNENKRSPVEMKNYFINSVLAKGRSVKMKKMFSEYLAKYNKSYDTTEYSRRFRYFRRNLKEIRRLNASTTASYGVTKFSDWSPSELKRMLSPVGDCAPRASNCSRPSRSRTEEEETGCHMIPTGNTTLKLDWREHGAVGPILNQKLCPICWAFSVAGVMESMAFICQRVKKLTRLSIQELMDCSFYSDKPRTGCIKGRPMVDVFEYLCDNSMPLATEHKYPLTFAEENCKGRFGTRSLKRFVNICDMRDDKEDKLVELLKQGPVTAAVDAYYLFNYIRGIITTNCEVRDENALNHAVQIVGYDKSGPIPYYIVRNSWGRDWGEEGYVYIAIGTNQCGIAYSIGHLEVY